ADTVRAAQEWVRRLDTDGGTNIAGALTEAFAEPPAEGGLGVVVFLTDGMATVGETNPERIADQAERGRGLFRVFAFGIGYDVNTYLLDRLTERARGVTEYIQPAGDIEQWARSPPRSRPRCSRTWPCGRTASSCPTSTRNVCRICSRETSWWCSGAIGEPEERRGP